MGTLELGHLLRGEREGTGGVQVLEHLAGPQEGCWVLSRVPWEANGRPSGGLTQRSAMS